MTQEELEKNAKEYAGSCDNESGSFLSHQLEAIRKKAFLAGAQLMQKENEELKRKFDHLFSVKETARKFAEEICKERDELKAKLSSWKLMAESQGVSLKQAIDIAAQAQKDAQKATELMWEMANTLEGMANVKVTNNYEHMFVTEAKKALNKYRQSKWGKE